MLRIITSEPMGQDVPNKGDELGESTSVYPSKNNVAETSTEPFMRGVTYVKVYMLDVIVHGKSWEYRIHVTSLKGVFRMLGYL